MGSVFISLINIYIHVKWVPWHHGMAHPQVADGGDDPQIWRMAGMQPRTDSRWYSCLGIELEGEQLITIKDPHVTQGRLGRT
jgi:hypothetical protein